jgi:hypothetical protein
MDIRVGDLVDLGHIEIESIGDENSKKMKGVASGSPYVITFFPSHVRKIISRKETDTEVRLEARVEELEKLNQSLVPVPVYAQHSLSLIDRLRDARKHATGVLRDTERNRSIMQSLDAAIEGLERKAAV